MSRVEFMDTNIVIPQSSWDIKKAIYDYRYDEDYGKYKKHIENAVRDIDDIISIIYNNPEHPVLFTAGVILQSQESISIIKENVKKSQRNFVELELKPSNQKQIMNKDYQGYSKIQGATYGLSDYYEKISKLEQYINVKKYNISDEIAYSWFRHLADDIGRILDIREDHKEDKGTDLSLIASCFYENMIREIDSSVISNDNGVAESFGAMLFLFAKLKPVLESHFPFFYENTPKLMRLYDYKKGMQEYEGCRKEGEYKLNYYAKKIVEQLDRSSSLENDKLTKSMLNIVDHLIGFDKYLI